MTMQHPTHPDDERLAALAGGDADATADAGLRAHVAACDRCGPMVAELGQLRTALAELPDLVPSRRIQLVPPAPVEAEERTGGWLRRLAAPMVATGMGLVLVGAIGTSGVFSSFGGLGGALSAAAPSAASSAAEDRDSKQTDAAGQGYELSGSPSAHEPADYGTNSGRPIRGVGGSPATPSATEPASLAQSPSAPRPAASSGEPEVVDNGGRQSTPGAPFSAPSSPWAVILLIGAVLAFAGGTILVAQRPARAP
jgi:hypothetical protein